MRIFISWSKEPSRLVAVALRDWLPDVIQSVEPWVSATDINAGARWSSEIAQTLSTARLGVICVTADNQKEPWLLFEAGALAKTLEDTFVCPYLIRMRPSDLLQGPLTQFQSKVADKEGTLELVKTINRALGENALPDDRLQRLFERNWPALESKFSELPSQRPGKPVHREQSEVLLEVLETVRVIARRLPEQELSSQSSGPIRRHAELLPGSPKSSSLASRLRSTLLAVGLKGVDLDEYSEAMLRDVSIDLFRILGETPSFLHAKPLVVDLLARYGILAEE